MTCLEAKDISLRSRTGKNLLDQVNIRLEKGQLHALLGPNGAGKSTLLKVLSGDQLFQQGQVLIDGMCLSHQDKSHLAKQRAVLPQLSGMAFPLTVEDVVSMGRYPHAEETRDENRQAIDAAMHQTEVKHLQQRNYPSLSGGEQQRTQLARVLAQDTKILLLDEPLSALDISHQVQIMQLLQKLAQQGRSIVVVLHDINLAMRYASHTTLLKNGRIKAQGETRTVITEQNLWDVFAVNAKIAYNPALKIEQLTILEAV